MAIKHHPSSENLLSCSAGSMPEAFAAVMASHMAVCPDCHTDLSLMEQIGVTLFESLAEQAIETTAPAAVLGASEADVDVADVTPKEDVMSGDVPAPLVPFVGPWLAQLNWKATGPGIWRLQIPLRNETSGSVFLVKIAPGRTMPAHTHTGREMTLVISGSFSDANGTYMPGDVVEMEGEEEHEPVSDPIEGCICLFAVEGPLKFRSRLARLVQPLTGF